MFWWLYFLLSVCDFKIQCQWKYRPEMCIITIILWLVVKKIDNLQNIVYMCWWLGKQIVKMKNIFSSTKLFISSILCFARFANGDDFQLTILHTNDIHSRIEQTNKYLGICSSKDRGEYHLKIKWYQRFRWLNLAEMWWLNFY